MNAYLTDAQDLKTSIIRHPRKRKQFIQRKTGKPQRWSGLNRIKGLIVIPLFIACLLQASSLPQPAQSENRMQYSAQAEESLRSAIAAEILPFHPVWMESFSLELKLQNFFLEESDMAADLSRQYVLLIQQRKDKISRINDLFQKSIGSNLPETDLQGQNLSEDGPTGLLVQLAREKEWLNQEIMWLQDQQRELFEEFSGGEHITGFGAEDLAESGYSISDLIGHTEDLNDGFDLSGFSETDSAVGAADGDNQNESLFIKACPVWAFGLSGFDGSSRDLMLPASGVISAGTWAYPGGGMHLGLDLAVNMYTPLMAPADGVILYASAPVSSNCGYLGNWCGWPQGGGNTICMLCVADGRVYGVSLCHLSNQIRVSAGMKVRQGDILALSGNSGNSSGPHTHIEVFEIYTDMQSAADYFIASGADFSFGCGWGAPAICSSFACRIRPESVF